jgi:hypothetical protein
MEEWRGWGKRLIVLRGVSLNLLYFFFFSFFSSFFWASFFSAISITPFQGAGSQFIILVVKKHLHRECLFLFNTASRYYDTTAVST